MKSHKEREEYMAARLLFLSDECAKKAASAADSGDDGVQADGLKWMVQLVTQQGAGVAMQMMRNSLIVCTNSYWDAKARKDVVDRNARERRKHAQHGKSGFVIDPAIIQDFKASAFVSQHAERLYWECFVAPEPAPMVKVANVTNAMEAISSKEGEAVIMDVIQSGGRVYFDKAKPFYSTKCHVDDMANDRSWERHVNQTAHNRTMDDTLVPGNSPSGGTLWKDIAEGVLADAVEYATQYAPKESPLHIHAKDHRKKNSEKYGEPVWIRALMLVDMWVSFDKVHKEEGTSQQAPATPEALEKFAKGGMVGDGKTFLVGEEPPEAAMSLVDKLRAVIALPRKKVDGCGTGYFSGIDSASLFEMEEFEGHCAKACPGIWIEARRLFNIRPCSDWPEQREAAALKYGHKLYGIVERCTRRQRELGRKVGE